MNILSSLRNLAKGSVWLVKATLALSQKLVEAGLARMSEKWRTRLFVLLKLSFVAVVALMAQTTALQALGRSVQLSEFKAIWTKNEAATLDNKAFPGGRVVKWVRDKLPADAKFLIYRQAEFAYYVDKSWVYDFDPKIIDLYALSSKEAAYQYILDKGITHIFVPNYMTATLYNSAMIDVIGDPSLAHELTSHAGMRLFEVFSKPVSWVCGVEQTSNNWVQGIIGPEVTFEAGGNGLFGPSEQGIAPRTFVRFREKGNLFTRRFVKPFGAMDIGDEQMLLVWPYDYHEKWSPKLKGRIGLLSGYGPLYLAPAKSFPAKNVDSIHMSFEVSGNGILEIWLYQYDANGGFSARRVWDAVISKTNGTRKVSIQARLNADTVSYRVLVNNSGSAKGFARVKGLSNCAVKYAPESDQPEPSAQKDVNIATDVLKTWSLKPVTSRQALKDEGTRIQLGTDCGNLGWRCRTLSVDGPSGALLMHPTKTGGVSIKMPVAAGFTVFTNKPERSLRTWRQCRIGRLAWFASRSPKRHGKLIKSYTNLLQSLLPELGDPNAPHLNLEIDMKASINTTVNVSLLWRDDKGRKNCTYLGEKAMESFNSKLVWNFPMPTYAKDINLAITTNHGLNEFLNMRIDHARLVFDKARDIGNIASGSQ